MRSVNLRARLKKTEEQARFRQQGQHTVLKQIRQDPSRIMALAGMPPDPWQESLLCSDANKIILLCSRQAGKSEVTAALALQTALLKPRSPILLLSPSLRQSGELFRKVSYQFNQLGRPMPVSAESALRVEFANGSRVVSLPGDEATVRGFSGVALIIIDEASRVPDSLYFALRPMLAVSRGRLVALSTPFGKRGWFHDEWHGTNQWHRVKITADEVPRISDEFLAEERRALGDRFYLQEYHCTFTEVIDAVFSYADIQAALCDDVHPLFEV